MINDDFLKVHVLASGSKGNSTLITFGNEGILIDAGISFKRISEAVKTIGFNMENILGAFITHEHSDHVKGLLTLMKKTDIPIYTKRGTWEHLINKSHDFRGYNNKFIPLEKEEMSIGNIFVQNFSIYHDAADPVGFSCYAGAEKASVMTDTGQVSMRMIRFIEGSKKLVLEANYDLEMLKNGPYPLNLKKRINGAYGHLDNEVAGKILASEFLPKGCKVILAHRSEENNSILKVDQTVQEKMNDAQISFGKDRKYLHAQQDKIVSI